MTDRLTPGLLPGQIERLALVAEECGEVLQVIGKVLRHGHESSHPNGGPTNRELLEIELGDLEASIDILVDQDLNGKHVRRAMQDKLNRVGRYLHHTSLRRDEAARREAEVIRNAVNAGLDAVENAGLQMSALTDAPPPPAPRNVTQAEHEALMDALEKSTETVAVPICPKELEALRARAEAAEARISDLEAYATTMQLHRDQISKLLDASDAENKRLREALEKMLDAFLDTEGKHGAREQEATEAAHSALAQGGNDG